MEKSRSSPQENFSNTTNNNNNYNKIAPSSGFSYQNQDQVNNLSKRQAIDNQE